MTAQHQEALWKAFQMLHQFQTFTLELVFLACKRPETIQNDLPEAEMVEIHVPKRLQRAITYSFTEKTVYGLIAFLIENHIERYHQSHYAVKQPQRQHSKHGDE